MKKNYIVPEILVEEVSLDDVIASSSVGGNQAGDFGLDFEDIFGTKE